MTISLHSRYRGAILGLAVGDAVGTALEFKARGTFDPITDMIGGGPFALRPGQWTDDTSMALCLAESLVECDGFDARDQMERYLAWRDGGKFTSTGRCFDIGNTVRAALARFEATGDPFAGSDDPRTAGNGSLMRLAPIPLFFYPDRDRIDAMAAMSSRTTHGARTAIDACRYFARLIALALDGASKRDLMNADARSDLAPEIADIAAGSYLGKPENAIRGSGYVVESLEAALWSFHRGTDYRQTVLLAANLGDDADTTAAIAGQIAGAHYGLDEIPDEWREKIAMHDAIVALADRLYEHAAV